MQNEETAWQPRPCLTDFRQPAAFRNERRISTPSHFLGAGVTIFSSHEVMYTAACFFRCCFVKWASLPLKLHLWKKNMKDPTYLSRSISSYSIRFTTSIQKCLNCLLQGGEPQKKICWISLGPTKPTWFHGVPTVWCDSNLLGASRFHLSLVNVHDENLKQHDQFLKLLLLLLLFISVA